MKNLLIGLLTVSLVILAAGCGGEDEDNNPPPPANETQIHITVSPDTLWFVYGEDATMNVTAAVTDQNGQPLAGEVVHLVLSDPSLGTWSGGAQTRHDTTGTDGHVSEVYHVLQEGNNTIAATVGNVTEHATLIARYPYNGPGLSLALYLLPASVNFQQFPGDTVAVQVSVLVSDEFANPVPNITVHFAAQAGSVDPSAITSDVGVAQVSWWVHEGLFPDPNVPEMTLELTAWASALFTDAALLTLRR